MKRLGQFLGGADDADSVSLVASDEVLAANFFAERRAALAAHSSSLAARAPPSIASAAAPSAAWRPSRDEEDSAALSLVERSSECPSFDYTRNPSAGIPGLREWRRLRVVNLPDSWSAEDVRFFFAACLAPRHASGVLRADMQQGFLRTAFVEFATAALTSAVLADLECVLPFAPCALVDPAHVAAASALRLQRPLATQRLPPPLPEVPEVVAAGQLGVNVDGLLFRPSAHTGSGAGASMGAAGYRRGGVGGGGGASGGAAAWSPGNPKAFGSPSKRARDDGGDPE